MFNTQFLQSYHYKMAEYLPTHLASLNCLPLSFEQVFVNHILNCDNISHNFDLKCPDRLDHLGNIALGHIHSIAHAFNLHFDHTNNCMAKNNPN